MKNTSILMMLLLSFSGMASDYEKAKQLIKNAPANIKQINKNKPKIYDFKSRFTSGSSVDYTGQVFRQILMSDIKTAMVGQQRGSYNGTKKGAYNFLNSYFSYDENNQNTDTGVIDGLALFNVSTKSLKGKKMEIEEGFVYSDIQSPGKNLVSKIAGVDNPLRRGKLYGTKIASTPKEYIENLMERFAVNATSGTSFTVPNGNLSSQTITGAFQTIDGVDLAQLVQKFLHGAVSYSQAARDYLSRDFKGKGFSADNTKPAKQGSSYSALEHYFDEGFGYFGAARDFSLYSDKEVMTKKSIDSNNDGYISILKEKNLGISTNSSRMDFLAADKNVDFSNEVMDSFISGRNLISTEPQNYLKYAKAYAAIALGAWEKTLAAVTIHYINVSLKEYDEYGTEAYLYSNFIKFWSEMKGFALAFQFNPKGIMSDKTFDQIHGLMGDSPVLPHSNKNNVVIYKAKLRQARDIMQKTYGFSSNNVMNW
jgi:hypothetical protein